MHAAPDLLDRLFSLSGMLVTPVWLLLIFLPTWKWTQRLATFLVPLIFASAYVPLLATAHPPAGAGFSSLAQVAALFSMRQALLAGWMHYLAFDLFTGAWEARDAARLKISRWLVAPCLVLTFLFGPVGLGLYLLLRLAMRKKVGAGYGRRDSMKIGEALPWKTAWATTGENKGVMLSVWWNLLLLLAGVIALPFDHRLILGLNPWIKPMKFEISIIIFLLTVALLLTVLGESGRWRRLRAWMGWGFGIAMIAEITIIAGQSARGVPSHMNYSTVFNALAFAVMGQFIALNTALLAILLVLFCITRVERPRAEIWGIRLGLAMILAGSIEGVRMVMWGAHTVGANDGGPGLPFINWSTRHGDLRAPHFFALHALQLLWLAGLWLGRTRLSSKVSVSVTWIVALLYAGGVWWLFTQAMAARPLLAMQ